MDKNEIKILKSILGGKCYASEPLALSGNWGLMGTRSAGFILFQKLIAFLCHAFVLHNPGLSCLPEEKLEDSFLIGLLTKSIVSTVFLCVGKKRASSLQLLSFPLLDPKCFPEEYILYIYIYLCKRSKEKGLITTVFHVD